MKFFKSYYFMLSFRKISYYGFRKRKFIIILNALLLLFLFNACNKSGNSQTPDIIVSNSVYEVVEDAPEGAVNLVISLSNSSDKVVTVDYSTADSTAKAGRDYTAISSGKLTINPGQSFGTITVSIFQNPEQSQDLFFKVLFSNPQNGILTNNSLKVKIINVDYQNLVWSDEFNESPLNSSFWNYEQGATGWGNNELQNYTSSLDNVHIDSGYLHITALNPSALSYTSGRITTQGKKEFTNCRVEIRAKLPEGKGIWPALWMLGANFPTAGWPKCGEIDIMELLGHEPSVVHGAVHWDQNGHTSRTNSYSLTSGKFSSGFHIFSLIWTPNRLIWKVDNQQFFYLNRTTMASFPFSLPQFFIFNIAVGGNWPGNPDETTVFPQHMIVDYIRVYQ